MFVYTKYISFLSGVNRSFLDHYRSQDGLKFSNRNTAEGSELKELQESPEEPVRREATTSIYNRKVLSVTKNDHFAQRSQIKFQVGFSWFQVGFHGFSWF